MQCPDCGNLRHHGACKELSPEVAALVALIDPDFDARVGSDPIRARALSAAERIHEAGYRQIESVT